MTAAQLLDNTDVSSDPSSDATSDTAASTTRIRFRQPVSADGFVDAAWWPRSHDLTAEVPSLLDTFWTAGREVDRITYSFRGWEAGAPRKFRWRGRPVHLGGFNGMDPLTVTLFEARGQQRIDVLVIDPATDVDVAERALVLAGVSGSLLRAAEIMAHAREEAAA